MKKILIVAAIIALSALVLAGVIYFLGQRGPRLTINVTPIDAFIEIENKIVGEGNITLKLNKGQYHIGAKKDGFLRYDSEITLEKDATINIILQKIPASTQVTAPLPKLTKAIWLNNTQLVGYQPEENKTYLIDVSIGSWRSLDFGPPENTTLLAVSDPLAIAFAQATSTTNKAEAKIFNLITENTTQVDFGPAVNPTSLSLSPNGKQLAFLSDHNYDQQTININIASISTDGKIVQISKTALQKSYSSVFWINESILGLSIYVDAPFSNQLHFFSPATKNTTASPLKFSTLAVQPKTGAVAALTQDGLAIVKAEINPKVIYSDKNIGNIKFSWTSTNQVTIIQQTEKTSVNITIINTETNESMNAKANIQEPIQTLIPSPDGVLYFLSPSGILYKLK